MTGVTGPAAAVLRLLPQAFFKANVHHFASPGMKHPSTRGHLHTSLALSFLLLDRRRMPLERLATDFGELALVQRINGLYFGQTPERLATSVRDELVTAGVARIEGDDLLPDRDAAG